MTLTGCHCMCHRVAGISGCLICNCPRNASIYSLPVSYSIEDRIKRLERHLEAQTEENKAIYKKVHELASRIESYRTDLLLDQDVTETCRKLREFLDNREKK